MDQLIAAETALRMAQLHCFERLHPLLVNEFVWHDGRVCFVYDRTKV